MTKKIVFISLLLITCLSRLSALGKIPNSLTPDEASQGYTAYSIIETGKDEWGNSNLLSMRSYGDFKPSFQTLLMIPSIKLFGLNSFALRLPSALFGVLTALGIFLLSNLLFATRVSFISLFLVTFSPWLLPISRLALEANIIIGVFVFALYFFFRNIKTPSFLSLLSSAVLFGVTPFIYHSGKIITPLFLLLLYILYRKKLPLISKTIFSLTVIFLFALQLISSQTLSQNRTSDIAIFHPTDNWSAVSDHRYQLILSGMSPTLSRLISNKATYTIHQFFKNYLNYFSFNFLLTEGASETTYGMMPGFGVLGLVPLLGIFYLVYLLVGRKILKNNYLTLFFGLMLLSPFPSALAKGEYSANRTSIMIIPLILLASVGLNYLINHKNKLITISLVLFFSLTSVNFFLNYFYYSDSLLAPGMLYGHQKVNQYLKLYPNYHVIYSRKLSEPQAYYLFYQKIDPKITQSYSQQWLDYENKSLSFLDQLGEYYLPYTTFKEISYTQDSQQPDTIIIGRPEEFPAGVSPSYTIYYPHSTREAMFIVNTNETIK